MKLKYSFFLLIILFGTSVMSTAQLPGNTDYNIWNTNPNDTFYIFSRMANVRAQPGLSTPIQDSLLCGTMIIIKANEKQLDIVKGINAPWVKVEYTINSIKKEGYVWVGLLALGRYQRPEIAFLYGIENIVATAETDDYYIPLTWHLKVKALSPSSELISESEWKMDGPEVAATGGKLLGDMGLKNTTDIVRIYFGGEACGVPTNYFYFGWTGDKLLPLPGKMEVGDAGVYYHEETFLFPSEQGGQPDKIIKLTTESEAEEKTDKNGEPIFKTTKSKEVFIWDGKKAVKRK